MNTTEATVVGASDGNIVLLPLGYKTLSVFNLLLSSIASVLCVILLFAMTIPLLYPKRRKYYSTYNLYLAFMALPELPANVLHVYLLLASQQWNGRSFSSSSIIDDDDLNESTTTTQSIDMMWVFDFSWDHIVLAIAATSNLYINAFLTYELYKLLKNSNARKKHRAPTIARVTLHAMISYGLAIVIVIVRHFALHVSEFQQAWTVLFMCLEVIYVVLIPLSVMAWVSYQIFRQDLLVSTKSMYEGRLRVLVIYFSRIVFSNLLLWIPAVSCYFLSGLLETHSSSKINAYNITLLFTAINVIVTFACSMTKPDARKLVTDMIFKLVYCRGGNFEDGNMSRRRSSTRRASITDPYLSRFSTDPAHMGPDVPPTLEGEGTQFLSQLDNVNTPKPEINNVAVDSDRTDIDPEA